MKYIAIALLLLLSTPGFSCDCDKIDNLQDAQRQEFEESGLIFIGEAISSDNSGNYQIKIVELLKGDVKKEILTGTTVTSCGITPEKEDGLWLVYTSISTDGTISIFACGLSRSFRFPFVYSDETPVPPPPPPSKDATMDALNGELIMAEFRNRALLVLKEEIEQLRKMK